MGDNLKFYKLELIQITVLHSTWYALFSAVLHMISQLSLSYGRNQRKNCRNSPIISIERRVIQEVLCAVESFQSFV